MGEAVKRICSLVEKSKIVNNTLLERIRMVFTIMVNTISMERIRMVNNTSIHLRISWWADINVFLLTIMKFIQELPGLLVDDPLGDVYKTPTREEVSRKKYQVVKVILLTIKQLNIALLPVFRNMLSQKL